VSLRIGLLAYCCDPGRGSEPGTGAAWVTGLTGLGHRVELVTAASPAELARTVAAAGPGAVTAHVLPDHVPAKLRVLTPLLPTAARAEWASLCRYAGWLSEVDQWVAGGGLSEVDVVQHVTFGSLNAGSAVAGLAQPVVFGPVGGGQRCPAQLRPLLGRARHGEALRDVAWALRRRRGTRFGATLRQADLVLAANTDTALLAARHGARRVELMMPDAVPATAVWPAPPARDLAAPLLLWVGSLRPRKAPGLALQAFRHVLDAVPAARLEVLGGGPLAADLARLAGELGIAGRVHFAGAVPHAEVWSRYPRAAVLLFTSVRDAFGGQALEAWAAGVPTVSFAHQGIGDFAPPGAALVGPGPAATAARRFAAAVLTLLADTGGYPARCTAALTHARLHTLEARSRRASALYAALLDQAAAPASTAVRR
jgi:glycosyltransferase involved in cell wall biosynthesis